jgi:hypothetical protein
MKSFHTICKQRENSTTIGELKFLFFIREMLLKKREKSFANVRSATSAGMPEVSDLPLSVSEGIGKAAEEQERIRNDVLILPKAGL